MREPVKDKDRLEHILLAIDNVFEYSVGLSIEDLEKNKVVFHAIVKNIEIIGEAAYMLTKDFCSRHADTPWVVIVRMRHVLVHDYYRIRAKEVWKVINEDLLPLREQVSRYIEETDWEEWERIIQPNPESVVHKRLVETATRMKNDGIPTKLIMRYTGLTKEEIEAL